MIKKIKLLVLSSILSLTIAIIPSLTLACSLNPTSDTTQDSKNQENLSDVTTAINNLSQLTFKDSNAKQDASKVLASTIKTTKDLARYFETPISVNGVNFNLSVKNTNNTTGSLTVSVTGIKNNQNFSKDFDSITGFKHYMSQKEVDNYVKISQKADSTKTLPNKSHILITSNDEAKDKLATLGISLTLDSIPTGLDDFLINSIYISFGKDNASANVVITGISGTKKITTKIFEVEGFKTSFTDNNIEYEILNNQKVAIKNYITNDLQKNLVIKNEVAYGNNIYQITKIEGNAFKNQNFTGTLTIGTNISSIGNSAFETNSFSGDLAIPDSVISIGDNAFSNNQFNGKLLIGTRVRSIGKNAFSNNNFTKMQNNSILNDNQISGYITQNNYLVVEAEQSFASEYVNDWSESLTNRRELIRKTLASPIVSFDLGIPENEKIPKYKEELEKALKNEWLSRTEPYTEAILRDKFSSLSIDENDNYTTKYKDWLNKKPTKEMLDSILNSGKSSSAYRLLVGLMNANMSPKELVPNDYAGSFYVEATYNNIDPTNFTPEYGFYELERKARDDNNGYDYTYLVRINSSKVKFDIENDTKVDTELLTLMKNRTQVGSFENSLDFLNNFLNDENNKLSQLLKNLVLKNQIGNTEKLYLEAFKDENGKYYIDISYKTTYQNKRLNTRPFNNGTTILTPLEIDKILGNKLKLLLIKLGIENEKDFIQADQFDESNFYWENYKDKYKELLAKISYQEGSETKEKSIIRIPFEYFFEEVETDLKT